MRPSYLAILLTLASVLLAPASAQAANNDVWAEALLSERSPYVQQTIVYTIRVYHGGNVSELNPDPINVAGLALEKVDGPPDTTHRLGRGQRMISEFRYALTPLDVGRLEVPSTRVKVIDTTQQRGYSYGYDPTPREYEVAVPSVALEARPVPPGQQQTWLPVYGLRIEAGYDRNQRPRVGQPLTLRLSQGAWGVGGERLPSLVRFLEGEDFKVYADHPEVTRAVGGNGRLIQGVKTETYTLIPQREGEVAIPAVRVPWWNLSREDAASTEWAGFVVSVAPGEEPARNASMGGGFDFEVPPWLWVLLVGAASFILGWWIRGGRPGLGELYGRLAALRERYAQERAAQRQVAEASGDPRPSLAARLVPARVRRLREAHYGQRARGWTAARVADLTPAALVTARLRRRIETAPDLPALERAIQAYAHHLTGTPDNASLPRIAAALNRAFPRAHPEATRTLLLRLDEALYGKAASFDRHAWMRPFRRVLARIGNRPPVPEQARRPRGLPPLNPGRAP
jgi:hypothetical protein